jgi:hypothetical protein
VSVRIAGVFVGLATAALFCRVRLTSAEFPIWAWLALISSVLLGGVLLARRERSSGPRRTRGWPEAAALGLGLLLGWARFSGPLAGLPELFNIDLEAAALVYLVGVAVFYSASSKVAASHRQLDPALPGHATVAVAAAAVVAVTSASMLYAE